MKMDPKQIHMAPFRLLFIRDESHKLWEASGMPPGLHILVENPEINVFRAFPFRMFQYFLIFSFHP